MTRVALYTRVSTEDQAREGFSLDAQSQRGRSYAQAQGWTVAREYVDEGHSGRTTNRPAYQRMMADKAKWDSVLVLKMDRIHRNSRNFLAMMDDLALEGKGFASVTENLDTSTAMGRFVMDTIQRIAQLESEQIGERVLVGMEQKARNGGGSLGGPAPVGYRRDDGRLVPVAKEARAIKEAYRLARAGLPCSGVARQLRKAYPWRAWDRWCVRRILRNPVYAGATVWNGIVQAGTHEAVVDPETFNAVQEVMRSKQVRVPE